MNLFETASLPPTRMTAQAAAPALSQDRQERGNDERGKDEVLLKLLRLEPDTMDHLFHVTGWDRDITRKTLLQLVADGKVKCTNRNHFRWYSVREERRAGA